MQFLRIFSAVTTVGLLAAACSSGDDSATTTPAGDAGLASATDAGPVNAPDAAYATAATFSVGGTVSGLVGTGLVLQDNAGDDLPVAADGTFAFVTPIASGKAYAVTVKSQPSAPSQTCAVTKGTGTVGSAKVTDVAIVCTTTTFTIGGTVAGLAGTGLTLQDNAGDNLVRSASGAFTFATPVASGKGFAVTVSAQPTSPKQTCVVVGGNGTVGAANVTSVAVNCTTDKFTISGTASGVLGTAVLQNNAGDDLNVTANGAFAFATPIPSGTAYTVTVKTQPGVPSQTCVLANAMGNVAAANVTNVTLTCTTNKFKISGNVTGLAAGTLVLQNNGADNLNVTKNGAFSFATTIASGANYAATVFTNPLGLICSVTNGSGKVAAADVTNVAVACAPAKTCKALKAANPATPDGIYTIDPDGAGGAAPIPAYCNMTTGGGGWTQVYDQDVNVAPSYQPVATWAAGVNTASPNSGQYAILHLLDNLKSGATFEFWFDWPTAPGDGSITWNQIENPMVTNKAPGPTVTNLVEMPANQTGCGTFQGLGLSLTTAAVLDADGTNGCWWWAVGSAAYWGGAGIPSFNNNGTSHSRLWVR